MLNKYLIQSKEMKIEILKYFMFAFFGFLGGKIVYEKPDFRNKTAITTPKNEPKAGINTSLENKSLKKSNKKDTIIVK